MKTLILYASSHGTTEKIARHIAAKLEPTVNCELSDIKKQKKISLDTYNCIVIGASIHAGNVQRSIRNFCIKHESILLSKPLALFLSGMHKEKYEEQFDKAFPKNLRDHAFSKRNVGGEFIFEKMNFFEKAIIKKITGLNSSVSAIIYKEADALAEDILALAQ